MKTTIDLADDLAVTLRKRTAEEGISLRTAVHQALRLWLKSPAGQPEPRQIARDVGIVSGAGLSPEAAGRSWEDLRAWSYDRNPQ